MSQKKDTNLNTNPWPVLLDHYNLNKLKNELKPVN